MTWIYDDGGEDLSHFDPDQGDESLADIGRSYNVSAVKISRLSE
jgi:hypothetical protein